MNQMNTKIDLDDRFMLKKIIIGKVGGDLFLYISFSFDYKVSS